MPPVRLLVAGLACVLLAGCRPGAFACSNDEQCVAGAQQGVCQESGLCSFPDDVCPSGQRYGEFAGELAGMCVPSDDGTSGESNTSSATTAESLSASGSGPVSLSSEPGSTSSIPLTTGPGTGDSSGAEAEEEATSLPPPLTSGSTGPPTTEDPYGPCEPACTFPGAVCLSNNQDDMMCAPPCESPGSTDECPAPLDPDFGATCFNLPMQGGTVCFIECIDGLCPGDMVCSGGSVCSYPA